MIESLFIYATHIPTKTSFVIEPSRKGSHKLLCFALPAEGKELDVRVPFRRVPIEIRRAARTWFES